HRCAAAGHPYLQVTDRRRAPGYLQITPRAPRIESPQLVSTISSTPHNLSGTLKPNRLIHRRSPPGVALEQVTGTVEFPVGLADELLGSCS
ncbi:unnamed protein product, partial [Urochloa humidicola]